MLGTGFEFELSLTQGFLTCFICLNLGFHFGGNKMNILNSVSEYC